MYVHVHVQLGVGAGAVLGAGAGPGTCDEKYYFPVPQHKLVLK